MVTIVFLAAKMSLSF